MSIDLYVCERGFVCRCEQERCSGNSRDPVLISDRNVHMSKLRRWKVICFTHTNTHLRTHTNISYAWEIKNKLPTPAWSSICSGLPSPSTPLYLSTEAKAISPQLFSQHLWTHTHIHTNTHTQLFWQPYVAPAKRCQIPAVYKETESIKVRGGVVWLFGTLSDKVPLWDCWINVY